MEKFDEAIGNLFEKIGALAAKRPGWFIAFTVFLMLATMSGMMNREDENRPEELWVPRGAIALEHKDEVEGDWPTY